MKILHGLRRGGATLEVLGRASLDAHNAIAIEFREGALEAFVRGEFFPFLLAGPADLRAWPMLPADLLSHRAVTRLWARKRGAETAKRDLLWQGWPLLASWQVATMDYGEGVPPAVAALLRPTVPLAKLEEYEREASGFCCGFKDGPKLEEPTSAPAPPAAPETPPAPAPEPAPPAAALATPPAPGCGRCPPDCGLGCDGAMHCADHCEPDAPVAEPEPASALNVSAGVPEKAKRRSPKPQSPQLGLFGGAAPAPEPPAAPAPPASACSVCGGTYDPAEEGCAPHAHAGGVSRVPAHVVRKYGPSPGKVRVRALGTCGLRFVRYGNEFDADRCPALPLGVWIVAPAGDVSEGCSFRLVQGEWEPIDAPISTP